MLRTSRISLSATFAAVCCATAFAQSASKPRTLLPGPSDVPRSERLVEGTRSPADYRSPHFVLHTDLVADDARALLTKLETMLALISKYWGQPLKGEVTLYVVSNLDAWPADQLPPIARAKIAQRSGITTTRTMTQGRRFIGGQSIVYSTAEPGTPEHEAVHAYCGQTFGHTGPLWYAEGMAEVGQYWREGSTAVHCRQHMIDYLRGHPKTVREIIADDAADGANSETAYSGDSWQAYANRWALCHLLVHNENYSPRFRAIGLAFLNGDQTKFADVFAAVLDRIEFEYREFVKHLGQGYRVDLCRWDWDHKFRPAAQTPIRSRIAANRGWQPTGALVEAGRPYAFSAEGTWQLARDAKALSAAGDAGARGELEAAVLDGFELGKPFPLGDAGEFTAPASGKLYVRCRDDWTALADNTGFVNLKITKPAEKRTPGSRP